MLLAEPWARPFVAAAVAEAETPRSELNWRNFRPIWQDRHRADLAWCYGCHSRRNRAWDSTGYSFSPRRHGAPAHCLSLGLVL